LHNLLNCTSTISPQIKFEYRNTANNISFYVYHTTPTGFKQILIDNNIQYTYTLSSKIGDTVFIKCQGNVSQNQACIMRIYLDDIRVKDTLFYGYQCKLEYIIPKK